MLLSFFSLFCSKCLNGVLPTALQTLQTWKSKSPGIAYRWRTKNCFPNGLQKFDERTRQNRKQPRLNVKNPSDDIAECEIDNMELEIKESEEERLRRRIKELELSLERETARRKTAEAALETKRFSVKNL